MVGPCVQPHTVPPWVRLGPSPDVGMEVEVGVAVGMEVGAQAQVSGNVEADTAADTRDAGIEVARE